LQTTNGAEPSGSAELLANAVAFPPEQFLGFTKMLGVAISLLILLNASTANAAIALNQQDNEIACEPDGWSSCM
jgi:hypothetical protein